ncbi:MAG: TetR/AcrR family transcriptional regulator [Spirochaetes bacterium]|nr:TetR/AcrR family transcriptional regulator [Spirochaetota bacterium]
MGWKQERGNETAAKILDTAMDIFRETGTTRIPVVDLSERSGATAGSIYHHYGCMNGVAAALYIRSLSGLLKTIAKAVQRQNTPELVIRSLVKAYLSWTRKNPDEARFIHASTFQPYVRQYADEIAAARNLSMITIAAAIHSLADTGQFVKLPEFMYEMIIIGPAAETARRWLDGDPAVDIARAEKDLPDRILRALT